MSSLAFDFAPYFHWDVPGPVPLDHAIKRVLAFCTEPKSGWGIYDLAAEAARKNGAFEVVTPWTLLLANALNGQVTLGNFADFTLSRRMEFARRLDAVPDDVDLVNMDAAIVESVVDACFFGYPGVWGPKITKVGALYRPRSIPVLDGHVALAFGFSSEGFSREAWERGLDRRARIQLAVQALAGAIRDHREAMVRLREAVEQVVPEVSALADLRLIDVVVWTSQDDRMSRANKKLNRWLEGAQGPHILADGFDAAPLSSLSEWKR